MEAPGVCEGPFNSCADILAVLERGTKESTVALLSQLLKSPCPASFYANLFVSALCIIVSSDLHG
jgi:hypothetical protein